MVQRVLAYCLLLWKQNPLLSEEPEQWEEDFLSLTSTLFIIFLLLTISSQFNPDLNLNSINKFVCYFIHYTLEGWKLGDTREMEKYWQRFPRHWTFTLCLKPESSQYVTSKRFSNFPSWNQQKSKKLFLFFFKCHGFINSSDSTRFTLYL